jgi:hypothetical protein
MIKEFGLFEVSLILLGVVALIILVRTFRLPEKYFENQKKLKEIRKRLRKDEKID